MEQRSPEWFQARAGKVTGSKLYCVVTKKKDGGYYSERSDYLDELVEQILTGQKPEQFVNEYMQHGIDFEPHAVAAYEALREVFVTPAEFYIHPTIERSGASPDGLVGEDGVIEVKCPRTATHIATLLAKTIPNKYIPQVMWEMACTGRKWCDFISYDPRLPDHLQMFVTRIERNDDVIKEYEKEVIKFLNEVDTKVNLLGQTNG